MQNALRFNIGIDDKRTIYPFDELMSVDAAKIKK
jgi:hypothetical protein